MTFLVLVLVLLAEKLSAARHLVQRDGWWLALLRRCESRPVWLGLAALVLVPVGLLGLVLAVLEPLLYGWVALPLHLLVLLYSLGRGDVKRQQGPFRDAWRRGDSEAAHRVAQRDLGLSAEDRNELLERVQQHLLWQAYQSFFAVIFWYALLGPMAALAYRLLALIVEHAQAEALRGQAGRLRHAFDWLPVRVLIASFALVGNFVALSRVLLHELLNWEIPAERLLAEAGPVAADLDGRIDGDQGVARLHTLWALLVRAAVAWYAVFALWTIWGG